MASKKKSTPATEPVKANTTKPTTTAAVTDTAAPAADAKKIAPIPPAMKLRFNKDNFKETITFAEVIANVVKKYPTLEEPIIKNVYMHARAGRDYVNKDLTTKQKVGVDAVMTQAKREFARHERNKITWDASEVQRLADEKAAKLKAEEDHKQQLLKNKEDMDLVLESNEAIVQQNSFIQKAVSTLDVLSDKIHFDEKGDLVVAEDAKMGDFQVAFAHLISTSNAGAELNDRSAKAQAAVGYAAKQKLGDTYQELFAGRPEVLVQVKRGIRLFETVKTLGRVAEAVFKAIPISTSNALLEMKVTTAAEEGSKEKADAKNLAAKKEVMKLAAAHLNETGKMTQKEALNIVSNYKKGIGIESKERFKFFHLIADANKDLHLFGMLGPKPDELAVKHSMLTIDYNGNRVTWVKPGEVDSEPISGPTDEILKLIKLKHDLDSTPAEQGEPEVTQEAPKKEGKAAKKKKAVEVPVVKEEEEEEEEEEQQEPQTGDDEEDEAPVKKKAAVIPVDDEEEEEEENDGDEDEEGDDTPVTKKQANVIPLDDDEEEDDDDDNSGENSAEEDEDD